MPYKLNPITGNLDYYEINSDNQDLNNVLSNGNNAGLNNIDMDQQDIVNIDKLSFSQITISDVVAGELSWNPQEGTLDLGLAGNAVKLQIGQENIVRVVNKTVPLINLEKQYIRAVKISGATGQRLSVSLAQANNDLNSATTIGLVAEDIPINNEGFIVTYGLLRDIDTTGALVGETWNDGDVLYLSPFAPGKVTNIKPTAPDHLVIIGYVEYAHGVHGKIFVKVDNGYELNELHDVAYPTVPANEEVLQYNQVVSRWENTKLNLANPFTTDFILQSSSQWSKTLAAPVTLNNGTTANGFTFFNDSTDRVASGCTSYNEFFIAFDRRITLTGTSGTANINVGGVNYLATFNTSLTQTAADFVTTHSAAILAASGIRVYANAGILRFGHQSAAALSVLTITNVTTNLSGSVDLTSIGNHVVIPYVGEPYEGLRLVHHFRVNFNITTGTIQTTALSLRRWADDSIIGSEIQVDRNPDVAGVQENFVSYTAGASDPFVTGGFYFALRNDSGVSLDITGTVGILIVTTFQKPVNF